MRHIGLTEETADQALLWLASHVPVAVPTGIPLVVGRHGDSVLVVTDTAFWFVSRTSVDQLCRTGGATTLVTFRKGHEVARTSAEAPL